MLGANRDKGQMSKENNHQGGFNLCEGDAFINKNVINKDLSTETDIVRRINEKRIEEAEEKGN